MVLKINTSDDNKICLSITLQFTLTILKYVICQGIPGMNVYNSMANNILSVVILLMYVWILPVVIKRNFKFAIVVFAIYTSIILINMLVCTDNVEYITEYLLKMIMSIIGLIFCYSIKDIEKLLIYMTKYAYLMLMLCFFYFVMNITIGVNNFDNGYSMSMSYFTVLPSAVLLLNYLRYKKIRDIILLIIGCIIILSLGSRGAFLCLATLLLFYIVKNAKFSIKNILIALTVIILTSLVVIYSNVIVINLANYLSNAGIHSRTIIMMLDNNVSALSGRDNIYDYAIELIRLNPLGLGIRGFTANSISGFPYPHNIVLEILLDYGVFIGGIIVICILVMFFNGLIIEKNKDINNVIILFFSLSIPQLMVSQSYLIHEKFWMLLGLCLLSLKGNYKKLHN